MLETLTIETFQPKLGELFHVVVGDQRLPMKLTDVSAWGGSEGVGRPRVPFALIFHTVPQGRIRQGTYRVENDNLEPFELFLVPMDPDPRGMRYQAVFA